MSLKETIQVDSDDLQNDITSRDRRVLLVRNLFPGTYARVYELMHDGAYVTGSRMVGNIFPVWLYPSKLIQDTFSEEAAAHPLSKVEVVSGRHKGLVGYFEEHSLAV